MANELLFARLPARFTSLAPVPAGRTRSPWMLETSLDAIDSTNTPPYSLVFDPQNHDRLLAAVIWRALAWRYGKSMRTSTPLSWTKKSGPVWRVAFDPEGRFVAAATNDSVVRLWTSPLTDLDGVVQLRGHLGSVFAVDISPENIRFCFFQWHNPIMGQRLAFVSNIASQLGTDACA